MNMQHLVIGLGEVGSAIQKVLKCDGYDISSGLPAKNQYDFLHICFPYSEGFVGFTKAYILEFKPKYVVVHSTVPLGTCDPHYWIHSPVRGVHPNLEEGIRTFTKYFGGANAEFAAHEFTERGITTLITTKAAHTEALKLWDTTQYGIMIMLEKEIYAYCNRHDLPFDLVYKHANMSYNEGYTKLGKPEVVRPYLDQHDGPIGGHCVMPNAELITQEEMPHHMILVHDLMAINAMIQKSAQTE